MSSLLQNTESRKPAHQVSPGFYFPTDTDGNVLPLFSGGRPNRRPSTLSAREIRPASSDLPKAGVMTKRTHFVPHRLLRARSAPISCLKLAQRPEPLHQAPLFPCDASGAVLPLFHPSTSTSTSPRCFSDATTTSSSSSGNSHASLPWNAPGEVLESFGESARAGSSADVPAVAVGNSDDGDGDDDEEEDDSVESVIEWIDEMLNSITLGKGKDNCSEDKGLMIHVIPEHRHHAYRPIYPRRVSNRAGFVLHGGTLAQALREATLVTS
ncbi:hypothetical protein C7212DRAFT_367161 [Tuber magnatum]|uniref:Uncharacterized protein n=1 Tax=Tuber magnatum TaxID=42249 RepID=A0A317SDD9_9PEZI|nr:hypothetical protein C7212DRAFT_367161 [Tuber magnatum]